MQGLSGHMAAVRAGMGSSADYETVMQPCPLSLSTVPGAPPFPSVPEHAGPVDWFTSTAPSVLHVVPTAAVFPAPHIGVSLSGALTSPMASAYWPSPSLDQPQPLPQVPPQLANLRKGLMSREAEQVWEVARPYISYTASCISTHDAKYSTTV